MQPPKKNKILENRRDVWESKEGRELSTPFIAALMAIVLNVCVYSFFLVSHRLPDLEMLQSMTNKTNYTALRRCRSRSISLGLATARDQVWGSEGHGPTVAAAYATDLVNSPVTGAEGSPPGMVLSASIW